MSKTIYSEVVNPNGNLLFSVEQLNTVSGCNKKCLPVRCLCCNKTFYISRKEYTNGLFKSKFPQYCSRECVSKAANTCVTKPCLVCGKPVTKKANEAKRSPNFFCCHSHAASYNNKRRVLSDTAGARRNIIKRLIKALKKRQNQLKTIEANKKRIETKCRSIHASIQTPKSKLTQPHIKNTLCKVCGQAVCKHPQICDSIKNSGFFKNPNRSSLKKFGFDMSAIGSEHVYDEVQKLHDNIYRLY